MTTEIGCFISPHGFGHATRTIALLSALHELVPDLHARFLTTVPQALFKNCSFPFTYHSISNDVGLVQKSALTADLRQTLNQLARFIPVQHNLVYQCADICRNCSLLLCDISILGILTGKKAGSRSVLVENFTWDWIYRSLAEKEPALRPYADYFLGCYDQADFRIQTQPLCKTAAHHIVCPPIARKTRLEPALLTGLLGRRDRILVLITMGGIPLALPFLDLLSRHPDYFFVLAGQQEEVLHADNVMLISQNSPFHHPDLIAAADLLVCKSGYSTIAECSQTNTPICCVKREGFAESAVLESWITNRMNGTILEPHEFFTGSWLEQLPALLKKTRVREPHNGARQAASFISTLL